ncbi:MAG: patatin-like phospholipase family protein [Acidobacteriota bacterium]
MTAPLTHGWVLDSGGAGRGAWQGGVLFEFMKWTRENGCYPQISMGASAGGYAAADVATGTEQTVLKGWTRWGRDVQPPADKVPVEYRSFWGAGQFRLHLRSSIRYVMAESEVAGVFDSHREKRLLIFTTRVRRRDGRAIGSGDDLRFFGKSLTRKLPRKLKYLPNLYHEDPVVFAWNLPAELASEYVRPLSPLNYHAVIEASCLVPLAMGSPLRPFEVNGSSLSPAKWPNDENAVFMDGGYTLKMPMAILARDERFCGLARWSQADKTLVFCCDPSGNLWETSARLRNLNHDPEVVRAIRENRLWVIYPDHTVEAGFLCHDNPVIMRTFERGREQARRLLRSDAMRRFLTS